MDDAVDSSGGYSFVSLYTNRLMLTHNNSASHNVTTDYGFASGAWQHVAVVFNGASRQLYVDGAPFGEPFATSGGGLTNDGDDPLWFGGLTGYSQYFKGSLDDIRIYNEALSASEVKTLSLPAAPATTYRDKVLADHPVMYWSFDENGASNAVEQVGGEVADQLLAKNGAIRAAHASLGSGLGLGNAARFDGVNDCFAAADLSPISALPGAYAIEFWMQVTKPETASDQVYCVNFQTTGDNHPAVIFDWKTPANEVELYEDKDGVGRTSGGPVISDADWHHLLFVVYGGAGFGLANRVEAFLDGESLGIVTGTFSEQLDLSQALIVGAAHTVGGYPLEGFIDELAVHDLSGLGLEGVEAIADRLALHWSYGFAVPEPSSLGLLGLGVLGLFGARFRRRVRIL